MDSYYIRNPNQLTCDLDGQYSRLRIVYSNVEILYLYFVKAYFGTADSYLKNLDRNTQRIKHIKQVRYLIFDIDISSNDFDGVMRDRIIDLIKSDIVMKHSQTIEFLHFRNFNLLSSSESKQEYELKNNDLAQFIIMNTPNIQGIIFEPSSYPQSANSLVLNKALDLISKKNEIFSKLSYFKLEMDSPSNQDEDIRQFFSRKQLPQFLIGLSDKISQIKSLEKLELLINNQKLDNLIIYKFIGNLLNLPNLSSFGIDISDNKHTIQHSLSYFKLISSKKQNLKALKFIDNQYLNSKPEINEFILNLKGFTSLKKFEIEGFFVKKNKIQQFLTYFDNLNNLSQIILDLSKLELSNDNYIMLFKQLSVYNHVEVFRLCLPFIKEFLTKDIQLLADFIHTNSSTLTDLLLSFQTQSVSYSPFYSAFQKLKQLKRIKIEQILKNQSIDFTIDAEDNSIQNNNPNTIFEMEYFDTKVNKTYCFLTENNKYNHFSLAFLKLIVILEAKNIKGLEIVNMQFYDLDEQQVGLIQKLQLLTNIEELSLINFQGTRLALQLLKNNQNSLKNLQVYLQHYIDQFYEVQMNPKQLYEYIDKEFLDDDDVDNGDEYEDQTIRHQKLIYKGVLKCKNLEKLLIQKIFNFDFISIENVLTNLQNLSYLQMFILNYQFIRQDFLAIINSSKLTKFIFGDKVTSYYPKSPRQKIGITDSRMAQIQQIFVFQQQISSVLTINPLHSIWDLFL